MLEGFLLVVVGSEVTLSRVAGLCRVMMVAEVGMVAVLGVSVGVMVGLAGTGVVLGALKLVSTTGKVLGERVEVLGVLKEGLLRGDLVLVRVGRQDEATAPVMVVCSVEMNGFRGRMVVVSFSVVSSS